MRGAVSILIAVVFAGMAATTYIDAKAADAHKPAATEQRSTIDEAIDSFQENLQAGQQKLAAIGRDIEAKLDKLVSDLERRYADASADLRKQWETAKIRLAELQREIDANLHQLTVAAKEQWRQAQTTAAESLRKLSDEIKANTPSQERSPRREGTT